MSCFAYESVSYVIFKFFWMTEINEILYDIQIFLVLPVHAL